MIANKFFFHVDFIVFIWNRIIFCFRENRPNQLLTKYVLKEMLGKQINQPKIQIFIKIVQKNISRIYFNFGIFYTFIRENFVNGRMVSKTVRFNIKMQATHIISQQTLNYFKQ